MHASSRVRLTTHYNMYIQDAFKLSKQVVMEDCHLGCMILPPNLAFLSGLWRPFCIMSWKCSFFNVGPTNADWWIRVCMIGNFLQMLYVMQPWMVLSFHQSWWWMRHGFYFLTMKWNTNLHNGCTLIQHNWKNFESQPLLKNYGGHV